MSSDLSPHALAPGTQIRDYTIVSVIGTGGFSIVYKALDNSLMREVAIKEYFPGAFALRDNDGSVRPHSRDTSMFSKGIESFLNEGKLLAAFDHPGLVRVYRCWEERGTAYLAMRLYAGTTLRDAVKAGDWRTDEVSLRALLQPMCDALDLLHASKCYHRDVAPDNIMLVDGGAPVLLDFGAARKAIESTQVFTAILKPGYAPIEQYGDGELKQGPWTDIYALAGVVYFTLSGNAPPTAISRMLKDAMPRPRDAFVGRLPEHWLDAIERALAVKSDGRPQTMSEFISLFGWNAAVDSAPASLPETVAPSVADERTVITPWQRLPVPAAPAAQAAPAAPAAPAARAPEPLDDDRTVVVPRRAVEAQLAASRPPVPMAMAEPKPGVGPKLSTATTPGRSRNVLWFAALAGLVAVAALAWKLMSSPTAPDANPTSGSDTKRVESPAATGNDASPDKKPSISTETLPSATVDSATSTTTTPGLTAPSISPAAPTTTPNSATPETTVIQSPSSNAAIAKARAKPSRAVSALDEGTDRTPPRTRKRPERCDALIARFGLGETLGAEDQRFFQESCK